jgi:hypothetical protein
LLFGNVPGVFLIEALLQTLHDGPEALLRRLACRAIDRRMAAPFLSRLAQRGRHQRPVGVLPVVTGLECGESCDQCHSPLEIALALTREHLKVFPTRLIGALRRLMEALPVGLGIRSNALADGFPVILQAFDFGGELVRVVFGAHQRFHRFDELRAFGRRGVVLPVLELIQPGVELLQLTRKMDWHRGRALHLLFDRAP